MKVSIEVLQKVYEILQDQGQNEVETEALDPDAHLHFIDAFEMPCWHWSIERGTFEKASNLPTMSGSADSRVLLVRDRLNIIKQCVLRNEHFAPSTLPSRDRDRLVTLRSTKQLLGRAGERFLLLGMLTRSKEGKLCLEDGDGSVELDFSHLDEPGDGLFTEGCFALVEGEYTDESKLQIIAVGQPPCESRETARSIYGHIDFLGKASTSLLDDQKLSARVREELSDLHFFFLSDVWLDHPQTLLGIRKMLENCIENDFIPKVIVLCGNFTSQSITHGNLRDIQRYQDNFDSLADLVASYPSITHTTHFVFVPGPLDLTLNSTLPRRTILHSLMSRIKSKIPKVHLMSNPGRIKFFDQEIVIYRDDCMAKMLRNVVGVGVKPDVNSDDLKRFLVQTILDQAHLSPLTINIQPTLSEYDHSLRLYPLPTALVLADKYDRYKITYTGCHVFNPGSFLGSSFVFSTYKPAEINSEEWLLFFWSPTNNWWIALALLLFRIIIFGLLLRTYIVPWLFLRFSRHIRIRSASLRSIRGLEIDKGNGTWRLERLSYAWSREEGTRHLTIKAEGLQFKGEISKAELGPSISKAHKRSVTATASVFVRQQLWHTASGFYIVLDPVFRPIIRSISLRVLRMLIYWVPSITSAVFFDIKPVTLTFTGSMECEVTIERVHLHSLLDFRQSEKVDDNAGKQSRPIRSKKSYSMAAWRSRLTGSFQRTWYKAIEARQGVANFVVEFHNVRGSLPSDASFFRLPGAVAIHSSMAFDPKRGKLNTHSLNTDIKLGGCSVDVDVLRTLLHKFQEVSSSVAPTPQTDIPLLSPTLSFVSRRASFLRFPSPLSPRSPSPPLSPNSGLASLSSIYSPSSPIFESITASILPRRHHYRPCRKLKDTKNKALISFLNSVQLRIDSISLVKSNSLGSYRLLVKDIHIKAALSDPEKNALHREALGRTEHREAFDSDAYVLDLGIDGVQLTRNTVNAQLQLIDMCRLSFNALSTQWPSPLLVTSPFLGGDPNAPVILLTLGIDSIHVSERWDSLMELFGRFDPREGSTPSAPAAPPSFASIPVPRVKFAVSCGSIRSRLIVGPPKHIVEMRNDGFVFSVDSHYDNRYPLVASALAEFDKHPLRMVLQLSFIWKPTFVRVHSRQSRRGSHSIAEFAEEPALLSLDAVEIIGSGDILADFRDETQNTPCIDPSSLVLDVNCSSDALCLELWHPEVLDSVVEILEALPPPAEKHHHAGPLKSLSERLPSGCTVTVGLARFVLFVTAAELNPNDSLELSRGLALRVNGASAQYCALHVTHLQRHKEPVDRATSRLRLFLPKERSVAAWEEAKRISPTSTFFGLSFLRVALRSALSTQFSTDDPLIAERDDPVLENRDFLQLHGFSTEGRIYGHAGKNFCDISARLPYIQAMLHVVDAYSMMLAIRTLKSLSASRPRLNTPRRDEASTTQTALSIQLNVSIDNIQAHAVFRNSKVFCRLDSLSTNLVSDGPLVIRWDKCVFWTRVPAAVNRWQYRPGQKWEEFLTLNRWNVYLKQQSTVSDSISVEGDAARFRIPFGFILADLILDLSVVVKALRHLHRVTSTGLFAPMPSPEAEGPKAVPKFSLQVGFISLEAADDPLESKLLRIFRVGPDAAKNRMDREDAFKVKVNHILASESAQLPERNIDWEFSTHHSVSIQDARERLNQVHLLDWLMRLEQLKDDQADYQSEIFRRLRNNSRTTSFPTIIPCHPPSDDPPLIRFAITNLLLHVSTPTFPAESLVDFLFEQGRLPKATQYTLLVPMHLHFSLSSLQITLRDYPLAMANVPAHSDTTLAALEFDSDLVIAEEMGTDLSVDWVECPIIIPGNEVLEMDPFYLAVPKTIMPVKSYALPEIKVSTPDPTTFCWGVSYGPATQDVMRIIDTLSSPPRDPSPPVGFWDKLRLVFHWSIRTSFRGAVQMHMKGLRDPYEIVGVGAGFLYSWQGHTKLLIGRQNDSGELVQVISDSMLIAIPNLKKHPEKYPSTYRKICAKFLSGVKFGIGFVLERSCGPGCDQGCIGSPFNRKCRFFEFKPHHLVKLEKKPSNPELNSAGDSFIGFRSNFIHLSISLVASIRSSKHGVEVQPSTLHLTPKCFTHFWSWWHLFDGVLSLPIRHGSYFPRRIISPKFPRHLATLKYRLIVPKLAVMHGYADDSRDTWVDGVTPWVGVKAIIEDFQVDMHQRDQEMTVPGLSPSSTKVIRRKAFYAAEVVMKNLDLRALVAIFQEPGKQSVGISATSQKSSYRSLDDFSPISLSSSWYDTDDFVETDWSTSAEPTLHILPVAKCPRISYFKKNTALMDNQTERRREPSVPQIQIGLASERIDELNETDADLESTAQKMIPLLRLYINRMLDTDAGQSIDNDYSIPADAVFSADEWAQFDNVFQIHCPKLFVDSAVRDIMMRYYHCSRARRGFEYHMATRAVKFIRDQAFSAQVQDSSGGQKYHNPAQAAASVIRKILVGETFRPSQESGKGHDFKIETVDHLDPMNGWLDGVSLRKSHCCLLLKPQIVLRNRGEADETCIVAAVQAKLQSFAIMDDANVDDPVTGKVMTRSVLDETYAILSGMQTFAPTFRVDSGDGCVPLEVLIDLRCESDAFERLVPQTDASFQYDKFNRLRLRNNVASAATRNSSESTGSLEVANHLHDQTDLIQVQIPRFTVSASDHHFETISNIITRLLLYSDAAHKTHLDHLETLLFQYDFTDFTSSAEVISDLQRQMRKALDIEYLTAKNPRPSEPEPQFELMKLRAHMFLLAEKLNFLFEAIKLAQDRRDEQGDRKSATLLHASSSEISWRMVDERRELLAKLAVQDIDFYWLRRQDSSTVNHLTVRNLQAFDGSRDATWTEIVSKYDEPAYHPLLKRGVFVLSNWSVLPPVGGITIYESFELSLHPLRLQIDAKVGRRIMEYVYPARKHRRKSIEDAPQPDTTLDTALRSTSFGVLDSPFPHSPFSHDPLDTDSLSLAPPLRKLGASRSFTDLRSTAAQDSTQVLLRPPLQRTRSSEYLKHTQTPVDGFEREPRRQKTLTSKRNGDAVEMKTRSSRKTFVFVKISSLHLLLSVMKEDAFVCRDARIRTRDWEFRNQTLSFEELVNQFIPSDMSWKGWVKMAFHQPLVPVLPVARELISKTKWIASKGTAAVMEHSSPPKSSHPKAITNIPHDQEEEDGHRPSFSSSHSDLPLSNTRSSPPLRSWKKASNRQQEISTVFGAGPLIADPEPMNDEELGISGQPSRKRVLSLFNRASSKSGKSETSVGSVSSRARQSTDG
ncbi:hypothetical protein GYMLUDRAFT_238205 [Collybiopsis luxurians FD-317 M1]|nr:hypothetical protein GYMLUDRAFT_238205 [Collybiopsis luxurians FD-317 M1]